MPIPLGVLAQAGSGAGPFVPLSDAYVFLTTTEATSGSEVTFSNLNTTYASTYKHLELRLQTQSLTSFFTRASIRFNGDTGTNYNWHRIMIQPGEVTGILADSATSSTNMRILSDGLSTTAAHKTGCIVRILDAFDSNKFKTIQSQYSYMNLDRQGAGFHSGAWRNTNAISSITIRYRNVVNFNDADSSDGASNFDASRLSLYGIKG